MNKKHMVLVALMIAATTTISLAQAFFPVLNNISAAEKERMDRSFAISLNSTNSGIVGSALAIVTMIKLDLPTDEFPMVRNRIAYLAAHSAKPLIRYRACLAEAVFANPAMFKEAAAYHYSDPSAFFSALDGKTPKPLLSSE